MPSPIAHSVTGYALFKLFRLKVQPSFRFSPLLLGMSLFAAVAADLDFLPQFWMDANLHRGITHSLGFTLGFSLCAAGLAFSLARPLAKPVFLLAAASYGSHLILDLFTAGGRGIQLLWPLSPEFFQAPFPLFPPVHHSRGLFDWGHLLFVGYELVYSVLLLKGLDLLTPKPVKSRQAAEFDS